MMVLALMFLVAFVPAIAQRTVTVQPAPPVQIRVDELVISGTSTLDSEQLNEITNSITGREYRDSAKEMSERLRDAFQQRGYFHPEVRSLKVKPLDPLGNPKPVRIEAEVDEGVRYRIAAIKFEGARAFSPAQLDAKSPIRPGEYFDVAKIRSGLAALRHLYTRQGYLMMTPVPETQESSGGLITLTFNIEEGQQFRMGTIHFTGDRDLATQLKSKWKLGAGEPFDSDYVRKFTDENKALLPPDFTYMHDVYVDLNCRDGIADVRIDADPKHPKMEPDKLVGCDTSARTGSDSEKQEK